MRRAIRARRASGFTLLELQIALLLLCIVVLGLMSTIAAQQRALSEAERSARLACVVKTDTRRVIVSRLGWKTGPAPCRVRPVGFVATAPPTLKLRVSAR